MSIPQLSEGWAVVYFHVLIEVLIFFAGLPLLIFQLSLSKDISRLYLKYTRIQLKFLIVISISIISIFLLIWFIHPCPDIISPALYSIIISGLLSLMIFYFIYIYQILFKQGRESLIDAILREYNSNSKGKPTDAFEDLTYLGVVGNQGNEKFLVINSIFNITENLIYENDYEYHKFDFILNSLKKINISNFQNGNEDNFKSTLVVLKSIRRFYNSYIDSSSYDINYLDIIVGEFCLECLSFGYNETAKLYQQEIKSDPEALLKVGIDAISQNKYTMAIDCLNDLEYILENRNEVSNEGSFQIIGLVAHIWSINYVARKRLKRTLQIISELAPNKSPIECFHAALEEFISIQDYITAQKIEDIIEANLILN